MISVYLLLDLISENLFCGNSLDWSDFLKSLDVKILLIAEDEVAPRLAGHVFVFKLHDVFESELLTMFCSHFFDESLIL